jgi:uncharacterized protein YjbI with pentapeptide repeats
MATLFQNLNFDNTNFESINNYKFKNCSFGANFEWKYTIVSTIFEDCSFNNNTSFEKVSLKNIEFKRCFFKNNMPLFSFSDLNQVFFDSSTNIFQGIFTSSKIKNCNWNNLNLVQTSFQDARLSYVSLNQSNFGQANLTNLYNENIFGIPSQLPTSWKTILFTSTTNILVGPSVNLAGLTFQNISMDDCNLYGANLSNTKWNQVSVNNTIFQNAVFRNVDSIGIKRIPASLPIGVVIFNEIFVYGQNDLYLPTFSPSITNTILTTQNNIPYFLDLSSSTLDMIYCGSLNNNEQSVLVYLTQQKLTNNVFPNTICLHDLDSNQTLSNFMIPNFLISSLTSHSFKYGKGGFLIGFGYEQNYYQPRKIIIRLSQKYELDLLYESVGYKIFSPDTISNYYPSGTIESILTTNQIKILTQSDNKMIVTGVNFEYLLDCSGINFTGKNLSGLDLRNRNFTNCDFSGTILSYSNLSNANFTNSNFYKTNLSYCIMNNVILDEVNFFEPNFTGISLSSNNLNFVLPGGFKFVNNCFIGPNLNLDGMDLSGVDLTNVNLNGCSLRNTILTNTIVKGTNFLRTVLDGVISGGMKGIPILSSDYGIINGYLIGPKVVLTNADLSGVDLSNLNLYGVNVQNARLENCIMVNTSSGGMIGQPFLSSNTKIINGYLVGREANLKGANLKDGNLTNLDLSSTIMTDVNFENVQSGQIIGIPILSNEYQIKNGWILGPNVNISEADLSGVFLQNLSLNGASIEKTNFTNTIFSNISSGNLIGTPYLPANYVMRNGYIVGPQMDLSGSDLSNTNLSGLNLDQTNLTNSNFSNVKSGQIVGTPFLSSNYQLKKGYIVGEKVDLSGAILNWEDFSDMNLIDVNFTNAKLNQTKFNRTLIHQTDFTNIEFQNISSSQLIGIPYNLPNNLKIIEGFLNGNISSRIFVGDSIKLTDIEFRTGLEGINFSGSEMVNVFFNGSNFDKTLFNQTKLLGIRSKNITGIPEQINSNWKIRNGYLIGPFANLMFSNFKNLDLSGLMLSNTVLSNVQFNQTKSGPFKGIPITDFDWNIITIQNQNYLIGPNIDLSYLDLSGQNLSNYKLQNTNLDMTNLSNTKLDNVSSGGIIGNPILPLNWNLINGYLIGPHANLSKAMLERGNLYQLNLTGVNFNGANLNGADLRGSNMSNVKSGNIIGTPILDFNYIIYNGYLIGKNMDLTEANLTSANLSNLDLSGTIFSECDLTNVNFENSNLTNCKFIGANLTGVIPVSIFDQIDLTGVMLPENNYLTFSHFVSKNISTQEFLTIRYRELKQVVWDKIFNSNQEIKDDVSLSIIKRINYRLYRELFILYSQTANGSKDISHFDQLILSDIDDRFQIYQRSGSLIQNSRFSDELVIRLLNRFDVEEIPESIIKNINFELCLNESVAYFYMKHLLKSKFHSLILSTPVALEKTKTFFRQTSKMFDDNLYLKNHYGITNKSIYPKYLQMVKEFPIQINFFENYLFTEDILTEYTLSSKIETIFESIIQFTSNTITPVMDYLMKRQIYNLFKNRDDFDLFKLNKNQLFVSFDFEKYLIQQFILRNQLLVDSLFITQPGLKTLWDELQSENPNLNVIKSVDIWANDLSNAIVNFRKNLFDEIKKRKYTNIYTSEISQSVLSMRNNSLDHMFDMNDENIQSVSEFLKENTYVKNILKNPKQFIQDIEAPNYNQVKNKKNLYSFEMYVNNQEQKDKLILLDIQQKINSSNEQELRIVSILNGTLYDENIENELIAPLIEYQRVWKNILLT